MIWYPSKGRVVYNPDGWIVLEVSNSICEYYRRWAEKLTWTKITGSLHESHVSILNGKFTDKRNHRNWQKFHNKIVDFEYSNCIEFEKQQGSSQVYYWIPVKCPFLTKIRESLDLDPYPFWPYHLTVGCHNLAAGKSDKFKKIFEKS